LFLIARIPCRWPYGRHSRYILPHHLGAWSWSWSLL